MESHSVDLQRIKRLEHTRDKVLINYDGIQAQKQFACTITTPAKSKYTNMYAFRQGLYAFLKSIDYKYEVKGFMEFHDQAGRQDKVHCHCVVWFGTPPKNNKKHPFHFCIEPLTDKLGWSAYCRKDIIRTLERQHDIHTGLITHIMKPRYLFTEDEIVVS